MESSEGQKYCRVCGHTKPLVSFYTHRHTKDGRGTYCRECVKKLVATPKAYAQRRIWSFRQKGIFLSLDEATPPDPHVCLICSGTDPGGQGSWHLDHDHDTRVVRGWLCNSCNSGLGHLKDSPKTLAAALRYLHAHGKALSTEDLQSLLDLNTDKETA